MSRFKSGHAAVDNSLNCWGRNNVPLLKKIRRCEEVHVRLEFIKWKERTVASRHCVAFTALGTRGMKMKVHHGSMAVAATVSSPSSISLPSSAFFVIVASVECGSIDRGGDSSDPVRRAWEHRSGIRVAPPSWMCAATGAPGPAHRVCDPVFLHPIFYIKAPKLDRD